MAETPHKSSPLEGLAPLAGGAVLSERPHLAKLILRLAEGDAAGLSAAAEALGVAPPVAPNTVQLDEHWRVFWLGPTEWLIHGAEGRQQDLLSVLQEALAGRHAAVIDVSDYYLVMRLSGPQARTLLRKGTPLDLHPRAFPIGDCAQTRFAHATVLLHHLDETPSFDIQTRWSHAAYVWQYLAESAREFAGE